MMPDGSFDEIGMRQKRGSRAQKPVTEIEVNEDGVALAFTEVHGDTLLFDHDSGHWFEWQGDRWQPDSTGRAFNYARNLARDATNRLVPAQREKIRKSAFAAGVERFARCDPTHAVRQDQWDADPWLLGCPGAVVDLKTGKTREAKPGDRITRQTAVAPYSTARCPTWLAFLNDATGGDRDLIRFLQQWCGYGLTGVTVEHALAFFYGPGGNGKSVFLNTAAGIMGDYAVTASMETFTASKHDRHPTDLAMLKGARLVSASETEEGRPWAESRIKQMTGGDPITARFMRQDFFTFKPQFKLTIVGNHQPVLSNVDEAAKRRFNIIPFTRKPTVPDRMLEQKLQAEWPGILRWAIEGCLDWQANGLVRPASVVEATAAYFSEQDLIGQWLAEKAIVEPGNQSRWEKTCDLFASWTDYAKANGESVGTAKGLAGKLTKQRLTPGQKSGFGRLWYGVNLKIKETHHDQY